MTPTAGQRGRAAARERENSNNNKAHLIRWWVFANRTEWSRKEKKNRYDWITVTWLVWGAERRRRNDELFSFRSIFFFTMHIINASRLRRSIKRHSVAFENFVLFLFSPLYINILIKIFSLKRSTLHIIMMIILCFIDYTKMHVWSMFFPWTMKRRVQHWCTQRGAKGSLFSTPYFFQV